jgi:hypothetical protein
METSTHGTHISIPRGPTRLRSRARPLVVAHMPQNDRPTDSLNRRLSLTGR